MADVPSIKATGFQSAADDLARLVASGRLPQRDLEKRLVPGDLQYLGKQLAASTWVPIATYDRVVRVLCDFDGDGDPEGYLRLRGLRAAERLHKLGVYRQFEASYETWGSRLGKISTTIASVLYNFTRWSFEIGEDERHYRIVVDDALAFPETLRFVGEGFTVYFARIQVPGTKVSVTSLRERPDRVVYLGHSEP
jgi:hypothetical protein